MAVLSFMGPRGRSRPARKYGPVHGQQLLDLRFLEELAQKLQSLDRQVIMSSTFNFQVLQLFQQVHLHSTRRHAKRPRLERPNLHFRRALARSVIQASRVGVASQFIPHPGTNC